jgi:2-dehydro-3-deoxyphosphogluconate aldolase/(4S)-4-hydroxy-2-oxoglutarate aldolase
MRKLVTEKMPGMQLGIGTIKTLEDAQAFMDAGADFIICPVVNAEIAQLVQSKGFLWIPGCMTPTEIDEAERNGASLVKIFPGNILGPGFVSAIKELFPNLLFMPTGGVEVDKENLQGWFKAGVVAVGMGSKLITKGVLENQQYGDLEKLTVKALELVKSCKN